MINCSLLNTVDYDSNIKVFIYWNLTRHIWSVKALSGPSRGRVIYHMKDVVLKDCQFKVSERQRQFILKNKRKVVHAGVVGYLCNHLTDHSDEFISVTYNPYKFSTFVNKEDNGQPIFNARIVCMSHDKTVKAYQ